MITATDMSDVRDAVLVVGGLAAAIMGIRALANAIVGDTMVFRKKRREAFATRVGEVVGDAVAAQVKPVVDRLDQHEATAQTRFEQIHERIDAQQAVSTATLRILTQHVTNERETTDIQHLDIPLEDLLQSLRKQERIRRQTDDDRR